MKLSLQGVTVISSSGDTGVAPRAGRCLGPGNGRFEVQVPSDCPYITTVGATQLSPGSAPGIDFETASTAFPSTGGFSNIYERPKYQDAALDSYFRSHAPLYTSYSTTNNASIGPGLYNRAGRGIPDLAVNGQNYAGFFGGVSIPYAFTGTSISAPLFAGMVSGFVLFSALSMLVNVTDQYGAACGISLTSPS